MIIAVLISLAILFIAYFSRPNKDRKKIYDSIVVMMGFLLVFGGVLAGSVKTLILSKVVVIGIVVFVFYMFYRLNKKLNRKKIDILATQQSFWGVDADLTESLYKDRIVKKKGRNEIDVIEDEYFFEKDNMGVKHLRPIIYADIKNYNKFTVIKSLAYFNDKDCPKIYKVIYEKLHYFNEESEKDLDFKPILEENNHILEFFILDLWETLATQEIIGVATLSTYATNDRELDLVGAMDIAINSNAVRKGFELYVHYMNFKGKFSNMEVNEEGETTHTKVEDDFSKIDQFEEEVKEILLDIVDCYNESVEEPKKEYKDFLLQLHTNKNPKAHGMYTYNTKNGKLDSPVIDIYDSVNNPREHLVATGVHELAHHIEYIDTGTSGHSTNFYGILKDLLIIAIAEDFIDYKIAYEQNIIDANDIKELERLFPDMREYRED
jgi:fumarate reductase subunit D